MGPFFTHPHIHTQRERQSLWKYGRICVKGGLRASVYLC